METDFDKDREMEGEHIVGSMLKHQTRREIRNRTVFAGMKVMRAAILKYTQRQRDGCAIRRK